MSDLSDYLGIAGLYQLPESKFVNLPPETVAYLRASWDMRVNVISLAKKRQHGVQFGETSALEALHKLAVWINRLPPGTRAALLKEIQERAR